MVPLGSEAMFIALFMVGYGVFMLLIGYWAHNTVRKDREKGRDVELYPVLTDAGTTYRKPLFQELDAIVFWIVGALFIGAGIWLLIRS